MKRWRQLHEAWVALLAHQTEICLFSGLHRLLKVVSVFLQTCRQSQRNIKCEKAVKRWFIIKCRENRTWKGIHAVPWPNSSNVDAETFAKHIKPGPMVLDPCVDTGATREFCLLKKWLCKRFGHNNYIDRVKLMKLSLNNVVAKQVLSSELDIKLHEDVCTRSSAFSFM